MAQWEDPQKALAAPEDQPSSYIQSMEQEEVREGLSNFQLRVQRSLNNSPSQPASSGSQLFPDEPRVNRIFQLNRAGGKSCKEKNSKHRSLHNRKLTREPLQGEETSRRAGYAPDIEEYNLDSLFEVKSHLEDNMSPPMEGGEDTFNLENLFAGENPPDKCTVLEAGCLSQSMISGMDKVKGQLTMESEVKSHLEKNNRSLLTGGEGTFNLEFLFDEVNPPDKCTVMERQLTIGSKGAQRKAGTASSSNQAAFRDGEVEGENETASELDSETDRAAGEPRDTCHYPGRVDLPQPTGVVVDLSKNTPQSSRRIPKKESVNDRAETMALGMTEIDKALPGETGELSRSTLRSALLLLLMLALGILLMGQETDLKKYTGSHDPNMHAVSSEAGSARSGNQSEVIQNLKTEHLLTLSNHGKILPTSVVQASMMELDPSEASQR